MTEPINETTAFPELDDGQLAVISGYGQRRTVHAGDILFSPGDAQYDFIVILSGAVEILRSDGCGGEVLITRHGPRRFLGEVSLLTRQHPYLTARVVESGELIVVPAEVFRAHVVADDRVSDTILEAFLTRRALLLASAADTLLIVGSEFSPESMALREYAARNRLPHRWIDADVQTDVATLLDRLGVTAADLPIAIIPSGVLRRATPGVLAADLGLTVDSVPERCFDVVVVGAGPAGLAASVYAASEGLHTLTVDSVAAGGQAATSSRIENYLGFPTGISGDDLANRATVQAQKFGAVLTSPCAVSGLTDKAGHLVATLADGTEVAARAMVAATGAHYRRLPIPNLDRFEALGVYYAATELEVRACAGSPVVVVGGGNSAGQAAMFLAQSGSDVCVVVRRSLSDTMSNYLVDRIGSHPRVQVHTGSNVTALEGDRVLEKITETGPDGSTQSVPCTALFSFIGAVPNSGWMNGVTTDDKGFVLTDRSLDPDTLGEEWTAIHRRPLPYESSRPGLFAVGDLRAGSMKRVAAAVGEGSAAIRSVHEHLALVPDG
jgi:thioredoxin reductase (NADPH)